MPENQKNLDYHVKVVYAQSRPTELLAHVTGLTIAYIKQAMKKGAVWQTDHRGTRRLRRLGKKLNPGSELHFYHNPTALNEVVDAAILMNDETDYSLWFKPSGMLSHGSKWGDHTTITRFVEHHFASQRSVYLVHRLDKAACGLMVLAHNKKTAKALSALFAERVMKKSYLVLIEGQFPGDKVVTVDDELDNKAAKTHAQMMTYFPEQNQTLLKVAIETGRKHQIRRHLSSLGYPVVGDRLYGGYDRSVNAELPNLQLCAFSLSFCCPIKQEDQFFKVPSKLLNQVFVHPLEAMKI